MAQDNVTPINSHDASAKGRTPLRLAPETRTVEARFYALPSDEYPTTVLIDGVAYDRSRSQEKALASCQEDEASAALLALVPEAERDTAATLLLDVLNAHSDWHSVNRDEIEAQLVELLPQHAPVIHYAFEPEGNDIPISEAKRHMHCSLPPASTTTKEEDAQ